MGFYKLKLTSIDQNTLTSCNKYGSSNTSTSLKILISCQDTWRPRTERRTMSVTMTSTVTPTLAADWDKHTLYTQHLYSGDIQYGWYSYGKIKNRFYNPFHILMLETSIVVMNPYVATVTSCFDTNGQLMLYH